MKQDILDYKGNKVTHSRKTCNGVRLHYYTAGQGPALILLHGVPKTSYYWRKLMPILTEKYTVVCPDLRGLGDSNRPKDGYDMMNMADDIISLADQLGMQEFYLTGEDWGAACAYCVAKKYPDRVKKLAYIEMLLPGFGLEDWSHLTPENVQSNRWLWHINFYNVPAFPEALITGRERIYFDQFLKNEALDCNIPDDAMDEYIRCYSKPDGIRCMCEIYRATLQDAEWNLEAAKEKLKMPVLALGGREFIFEEVEREMKIVAEDVTSVVLDYGHQMAEECPELLAAELDKFFSK